MSCGVGHRLGSDLALLRLWHRLAATALIPPLARESPYAVGVALKRQRKKEKREREGGRKEGGVRGKVKGQYEKEPGSQKKREEQSHHITFHEGVKCTRQVLCGSIL